MTKTTKRNLNIVAFLTPAFILFIGVLIAPIIISFIYSLFEMKQFTLKTATFIGFDNYKQLFATEDDTVSVLKALFSRGKVYGSGFITSLQNSLILAFFSVFVQLPISLGLALILGRKVKGGKAFLSIYFLPVLISTVIIAQMFTSLYNPSRGLMAMVDHESWIWNFLYVKLKNNGFRYSLAALFVPILWQYIGYHMLLMYAGVKGVSLDLREAAMLDGATNGQVNRYIVLPIIKPIIKVSVIFAVTGSLKSYDLIKMFVGDTYDHTLFVPSVLLVQDLQHNNFGRASAIATMLIILCFFFALIIGFVFKDKEREGVKK